MPVLDIITNLNSIDFNSMLCADIRPRCNRNKAVTDGADSRINNRETAIMARHRTSGECVSLVLVVVASALTSGCDSRIGGVSVSATKLTAEEAGYLEELKDVIEGVPACANEIYAAILDRRKHAALRESDQVAAKDVKIKENFDRLRQLSATRYSALSKALPPASMKITHDWNKYLLARVNSATDAASLESDYMNCHNAAREFALAVEKRDAVVNSTIPLSLTYKPNGSPAAIGADLANGQFFVDIGIDTPVGSFAAARSTTNGVKKLIIRSNGQERFFSLDRDFTVFIPTDYGVQVSSDGEKMILEVKYK